MKVCLIGKSDQSAKDLRMEKEKLEGLLSDTNSVKRDEAVRREAGNQVQSALGLIVSGDVDSICFRSHEVLGLTQKNLTEFEKVLSESGIGLSVISPEEPVVEGDGDRLDTRRQRSDGHGGDARHDDGEHQSRTGIKSANQVEQS